MGALGWSDGAGPSSVVCANAPVESVAKSANVKTVKLPLKLFFITCLLTRPQIDWIIEMSLGIR
jgi:hypothetical protein